MPTCYPHLLDPAAYPDYTRRPMRVPTWATFDHATQFTALRDLSQTTWREDLERCTAQFGLGRVVWPLLHMLWAPHVGDAIEEIRRRGLYLFDLWSHVPGSPMEGIWSHITPPAGMVAHLERTLGERFLGVDVGEQDGRYVGGYAPQQCPNPADRLSQYLNFQRHFEQMGDDLGNRLSGLVSLCFGHYFLKEGNFMLLGAETAQALPNSQVYYAFIRGAGRQYGVHWFGNASVYNRWGWKTYEAEHTSPSGGSDANFGPWHGTSLNLLKRLLYTHLLYNAVAAGFEQSWLQPDAGDDAQGLSSTWALAAGQAPAEGGQPRRWKLSPIGRIQAAAAEFTARHGQPGVVQTPVALVLDFYAGWAPPRNLYQDGAHSCFQVWGGAPYQAGDYLTHGVLSMLYPGYEDASYFPDERGFLSPTPYGDSADVVLSDAPAAVLGQYGLAIAAGALNLTRELRDTLRAYVAGGGLAVLTAENARGWVPGLEIGARAERMPAGAEIAWSDGARDIEPAAFDLCPAAVDPERVDVLASCAGRPAVARVIEGRGAWLVLLSPFGLNAEPLVAALPAELVGSSLPSPFTLLAHARRALDGALRAQQLFSAGDGLSLIVCRAGPGRYTLGVHNNDLRARPLRIVSHCGPIRALAELPLDQSEKGQPGYWPGAHAGNDGGASGESAIAGGDIRLFAVEVDERGVALLPPCAPPPRPRGRWLALRGEGSIQERILARPTFFQHFDGVKVDWTSLLARDRRQIERERGWLERQQARVAVDFSPGLNFYPDLTLLDTLPSRYEASAALIDDVLDKMALLGARDAVFCLHRKPENHCDDARAEARFLAGACDLCDRAARRGVTLHLQHHPHKWRGRAEEMLAFVGQVGAPNLRFALNTGHCRMLGEDLADTLARAGDRLGMILISAPRRDRFGQVYDAHAPAHDAGLDLAPLRARPQVPQALDAIYPTQDDEYLDCLAAWAGG
jgi:hypothetical protein